MTIYQTSGGSSICLMSRLNQFCNDDCVKISRWLLATWNLIHFEIISLWQECARLCYHENYECESLWIDISMQILSTLSYSLPDDLWIRISLLYCKLNSHDVKKYRVMLFYHFIFNYIKFNANTKEVWNWLKKCDVLFEYLLSSSMNIY